MIQQIGRLRLLGSRLHVVGFGIGVATILSLIVWRVAVAAGTWYVAPATNTERNANCNANTNIEHDANCNRNCNANQYLERNRDRDAHIRLCDRAAGLSAVCDQVKKQCRSKRRPLSIKLNGRRAHVHVAQLASARTERRRRSCERGW